MNWLSRLFGIKPNPPMAPVPEPRWTSHSGDEWWCDDARAGYSCGNFTIGTFGRFAGPTFAYKLIKDARQGFPDATLDVYLDDDTQPIVQTLVERNLIVIREVELSPKTRVARIEHVY